MADGFDRSETAPTVLEEGLEEPGELPVENGEEGDRSAGGSRSIGGASENPETDDCDEDWAAEDRETVGKPLTENDPTRSDESLVDDDEDWASEDDDNEATGANPDLKSSSTSQDNPESDDGDDDWAAEDPETLTAPDAENTTKGGEQASDPLDKQGVLAQELPASATPQEVAKAVGDTPALQAIEDFAQPDKQSQTVRETTLAAVPMSPEAQQALRDAPASQVEAIPPGVIGPVRTDSLEHAGADLAANEARIRAATAEAARRTASNLESLTRGDGRPADDIEHRTEAVRLNEAQTQNLGRFESKLPVSALETQVFELPSGSKALQSDVPGEVPGSKAVYEKQIDEDGKTVQYYKTTYDPEGNIVHIKDKLNGTTITPGGNNG